MEKYEKYFKRNVILHIPEVTWVIDPRTLSLVIVDLKTRTLASIKNNTFEEVMKSSWNPCQYYCRCSYATWNILLPTKEQAAKLVKKHYCKNFLFPTRISRNAPDKSYRLQYYCGPIGEWAGLLFRLRPSRGGHPSKRSGWNGEWGLFLPRLPEEGGISSNPRHHLVLQQTNVGGWRSTSSLLAMSATGTSGKCLSQ